MKNHYQMLGVANNASATEIKTAYDRKCATTWERYKLDRAYKILEDVENRKIYDQLLVKAHDLNSSKNYNKNVSNKTSQESTILSLLHLVNEITNDNSRLSLNEGLDVLSQIDQLIKSFTIDNPKNHRKLIFTFGKQIRDLLKQHEVDFTHKDNEHSSIKPLKIINNLLLNHLGYGLLELDLLELDEEITRLGTVQKDPEYKKTFIQSLKHHIEKTKQDIEKKSHQQKQWEWGNRVVYSTINEVLNSPSVQLTQDITKALRHLQYTPESKQQDKDVFLALDAKYQEKSKKMPQLKPFLKSIATIIFAGLSCILSIPFSLVGFFCVGPPCVALPVDVTMHAKDLGKKITGLPSNVPLSQHIFWKNPFKDGVTIAKDAERFLDSEPPSFTRK